MWREGIMSEVPANVPGAGSDARITGPARGGTSNSIIANASLNIADNDGAAAVINNLLRAGAAENPLNKKNCVTITGIIRENVANLKHLTRKLEERLRELGRDIDGFQGNGILERLKEQIDSFNAGRVLENLKKEIDAIDNGSDGLKRLKKEIQELLAFEETLLRVQEKIDKHTEYMQLRFEQISGDEKGRADVVDNLELGRYTVARMKDEALEALWGQANLNAERVLNFLKNTRDNDSGESENNSL
jgi:hypothetical protein